jgi:hypothetical protein
MVNAQLEVGILHASLLFLWQRLLKLIFFHHIYPPSYPKLALLENITNASILSWRHVNLHGIYDFSNLLAENDQDYSL